MELEDVREMDLRIVSLGKSMITSNTALSVKMDTWRYPNSLMLSW